MMTVDAEPAEIIARKGEVIGLAGIAGQGQEEVLDRLWRGNRGDVEVSADRAYVPGDRQRSGILPLWDVAANLSITALPNLARRGIRQFDQEDALVTTLGGSAQGPRRRAGRHHRPVGRQPAEGHRGAGFRVRAPMSSCSTTLSVASTYTPRPNSTS